MQSKEDKKEQAKNAKAEKKSFYEMLQRALSKGALLEFAPPKGEAFPENLKDFVSEQKNSST